MSNIQEYKKRTYYDYILKVLSISKIGLLFSNDPYALENYEELRKLSLKMLEEFENISLEGHEIFDRCVYPTPNLSARVVIFNNQGEILMIKEASDEGKLNLPGGWCDIDETVKECAIKECEQEAGIIIKNLELVGILSKKPICGYRNDNYNVVQEEMCVFKAEIDKYLDTLTHESLGITWVDPNKIENISKKIKLEEIQRILKAINERKIFVD